MKKSFLVYNDHAELFDQLSDEDRGKLFQAMYRYSANGQKTELPKHLQLVFISIKQQIQRDAEKYEKVCDRNKRNGVLGGRPKTQDNPENPVGYLRTQNNPKNPVAPDKDIDKDIDKDKDIKKSYISYQKQNTTMRGFTGGATLTYVARSYPTTNPSADLPARDPLAHDKLMALRNKLKVN